MIGGSCVNQNPICDFCNLLLYFLKINIVAAAVFFTSLLTILRHVVDIDIAFSRMLAVVVEVPVPSGGFRNAKKKPEDGTKGPECEIEQ